MMTDLKQTEEDAGGTCDEREVETHMCVCVCVCI
jgi:hypothetical protein